MEQIKQIGTEIWEGVLLQFNSSESRLHWMYLLSSLLIGLIVIAIISYKRHKKIAPFLVFQELFDPKIWLHKSAIVDYKIFLLNTIILSLAIVPFFVSTLLVMDGTKNQLLIWFGEPSYEEGSLFWIAFSYTVILWLISDFSRFFLHFLLHKIPFLWKLHAVHHSAEVMTPVTQYRMHPIEMLLFYFRGAFVIGIISGTFLYYYPLQFGYLTIFGVNIFHFVFLFMGSNLRHSHIPMKFPKFLEYIFISPYQHQIHHSDRQEHFDKNYGSHLAIWDWMFSTLVRSKEAEKINFGIPEGNPHKSVVKAYFEPFVRIFKKS